MPERILGDSVSEADVDGREEAEPEDGEDSDSGSMDKTFSSLRETADEDELDVCHWETSSLLS